jgi:GT2 family glycosyltransferase/SAM-dependent methyltransferase/glycosyltransferase involved in cell wall biosynthesis
MTIGRRSGAPRLIDWTGERCVPWAPDVQVVYEHMHRYLWAAELVSGRRVLDLASGEGFGAGILARSATSVTGIEIDARTVDHAALNYGGDRVSFTLGDARDLSAFPDGSFGAVIAFEMIEHVSDQSQVLSEAARVLAPDGLLIMSTPDRRAYSEGKPNANPFHVKELALDEFRALLASQFEHLAVWGQRTITGSALSAITVDAGPGSAARTFFIEPEGDEWTVASGLSPLYLVAVASQVELPAVARESTLADADIGLVRAAERRGNETVREVLRSVEDHDRELADARRVLDDRVRALSDRETELAFQRRRLAASQAEAQRLAGELAVANAASAEMRGSITWRWYRRGRNTLFASLGGRDSIAVRLIQAGIRGAARARGRLHGDTAGAFDPWPAIGLPEFAAPTVSLVIPLHAAAQMTLDCLRSIADHTDGIGYEVILVDDASDADTKAMLTKVSGARIIVNDSNLGYLRSVNRGAAAARGEWIVLCNNDIQVRDGWLRALLECGESAPDIAAVTPMYLYPDGALNEAGGIIWRDGTGMNYGRGQDPTLFHYRFRREVDYGSAAALMVRASVWRTVGGYDERFVPMYYEDADLCFQIRELDMRVMYEPRATVIHVEGGTAGIDPSSGHKRFQEANRTTFVAKWEKRLAEQPRSGAPNLREASNRARGPRVLIIDHRVPMWDQDAGSVRMRAMVEALIALGCRVTLLPDDRNSHGAYGAAFEQLGVELWAGNVNVWGELHEIGPELTLVISSRPQPTSRWLDLVRETSPGAAVVYDTVDLHWLREARRAGGSVDALPHGSRAQALRELETALIRAADATMVVTREERDRVRSDVPGTPVWVVPTINPVRTDSPPVALRTGVLFVGGFEHPPNTAAVIRLVKDVMPLVWRKLGAVAVTIVGGSAPPEVEALRSAQVDVAGWLPEVDSSLDTARVMLAPITWGAGLKGKVTQSLAAGLPVVTTTLGAEGLDATDGCEMLIADDDEELAQRVIRLLTDDELWTSVAAAGKQLAERLCSPTVMVRQLEDLLRSAPELRSGEYGGQARALSKV